MCAPINVLPVPHAETIVARRPGPTAPCLQGTDRRIHRLDLMRPQYATPDTSNYPSTGNNPSP
ncbi:hypothetical protein [Streptomyces lydicus]|uniref:hypothetical protein n=1 Tax=Streptomyces lydicus TaxID=47763 RepID=UPI0037B5971F